eukprot:2994879-Rhodomonas_salina.1
MFGTLVMVLSVHTQYCTLSTVPKRDIFRPRPPIALVRPSAAYFTRTPDFGGDNGTPATPVSYTHLRAHETEADL